MIGISGKIGVWSVYYITEFRIKSERECCTERLNVHMDNDQAIYRNGILSHNLQPSALYLSAHLAEPTMQKQNLSQPILQGSQPPHPQASLTLFGTYPFGSLITSQIPEPFFLSACAKGCRAGGLFSLSALTCTLGRVMPVAHKLGIVRMFGGQPSVP
jgi:hypothetical protein